MSPGSGPLSGSATRLPFLVRFFAVLCLLALAALALTEYTRSGAVRQSFVFFRAGAAEAVEERMIRRPAPEDFPEAALPSTRRETYREAVIRRYVEETLLGPVSPALMPVFPADTVLRSLLFREGIVYLNLSGAAVLAAADGDECFRAFQTLYAGILRNFGYVRDIHFFVEGTRAWAGRLRENFPENARKIDN